jgi:filamentous hemagglutinin family protein
MNQVDQNATRRRRQGIWLSTCAMATALAVAPQAARAQAFQGTGSVVTGSATITTGTAATSIAVGAPETVINWAPTDVAASGTIDFLPAGTTATFSGSPTYTVLNRILPASATGAPTARMVAFNGTVNSTVSYVPLGGLAVVTVPGGNVWFYTPTGFVIGPTATMKVGGLVLTTDDIQFTPNPPGAFGSIYGPGGVIQFRGPAGSKGLIDVQSGAQLSAVDTLAGNSYIAMVAPRIQQGGTVSAERGIGYIAAEQADLTINAGMFNISILAGTTDPNGIVHTGTTTGTQSASAFDAKTISFVALPKATALTMLLSGSIGYAPAADAFNDGSAVVLSSGYATDLPTDEVAGSLGNIAIDNASFANPTRATASGTIGITATGGPVSFGGDAFLDGQDAVNITLGSGEHLSGGSLYLNAGRSGIGGSIDVEVGKGASLATADYLELQAGSMASTLSGPAPVDASGGTATIVADGGAISSAGIFADASATAGFGSGIGGKATGGSVAVTALNGGSISATYLDAGASASAGPSDGTGGDAIGGSMNLTSAGGQLNFGAVALATEAYAAPGGVVGGVAKGGTATVSLSGGTYNWDSLGAMTTAFAGYQAGSQGNSASVPADALKLTLDNNATLNVANDIYFDARALASVDGAAGTSAQGGGIDFTVSSGSTLSFTYLTAFAGAGVNLSYFDGVTPAVTPDVTGGTINFTTAGQITGSSINLNAQASELGASTTSGTARGGTVDMLVNGGNVTLDDGSGTSALNLDANGRGAIGTSPANAIGGSATLSLADGTVNVAGSVVVDGRAQWYGDSTFIKSGPDPQTGFDAHGGLATVELLPGAAGTAKLTTGSLIVDASGDASTPEFNFVNSGDGGPPSGTYGGPMLANGGDGTGGTATLTVAAGTLDLSAGSALVEANGQGGISGGSTPAASASCRRWPASASAATRGSRSAAGRSRPLR